MASSWLSGGLLLLYLTAHVSSSRLIQFPKLVMKGASKGLPVVMWHGMGDSCCDPQSIGSLKKLIEDKLGVYVYSIATGSSEFQDIASSYLGNVNDQVAQACTTIRNIPELQDGYAAIGFSQGSQFIRALVQRCQHTGPPAKMLITVGGQHQGISSIPGCPEPDIQDVTYITCRIARSAISRGAYAPWVRSHIVQAQYFKDPFRQDAYLAHNPFLPDINNELAVKNSQYAANLASLDKLVLIRFRDDSMVVPKESSWFGFYNGTAVVPLQDQEMYKEDWLGLRQLDEAGRLVMEEWPGGHMQFSLAWFEQHVIDRHLRVGEGGGGAASAA